MPDDQTVVVVPAAGQEQPKQESPIKQTTGFAKMMKGIESVLKDGPEEKPPEPNKPNEDKAKTQPQEPKQEDKPKDL